MRFENIALVLGLALLPVGCSEQPVEETTDDFAKGEDGKYDASLDATILEFEFDGELLSDSIYNERETIQDQLLYTIGHLNGERSVGRLDKVELTNLQTSQVSGKTRLAYRARMPVAWGSKTNLPESYAFVLPRDVSSAGTEAFTKKYKDSCAEWGAHDVDSGSMWYYFRPNQSGCKLDDADVVKFTAKVVVSKVNTTGKFPEYHKVWEDKALNVVAVFGKYEDGAKTSSDAGISAFNEFVGAIGRALSAYKPTTTPATVPANPGVEKPDIEWKATLPDGKTIQVNALLVDNIAQATPEFYARYEGLSTRADMIAYNGHAGLGQNVRALARKGKWVAGQYVIVFMNGCDTYAYVDGYLAQTRAAINADDPKGSKYMDFVVNAMPAFFASDSEASMAVINGLLAYAEPRNYERIFKDIDRSQVVLVTGEEDNVYFPGYGTDPVTPPAAAWAGLSEGATVKKSEQKTYQTPSLPAATYQFDMSGSGDADLYVRVGQAPTAKLYDCRPYRSGSKESCKVVLTSAAPIHIMVSGYAASSDFKLAGRKL